MDDFNERILEQLKRTVTRNFFKKNGEPITSAPAGIDIKAGREDAPEFKRIYTSRLNERASLKVEVRTFIGRRISSGELTQSNGRYILFDPDRIADKILDPILVPLVEERVKEILELDRDFMKSNPKEFTDERGTIWRKAPIRLAHREVKALYDWMFTHRTSKAVNHVDTIQIEQSSASGIGVKSVAECSCGAKTDITDYSKW